MKDLSNIYPYLPEKISLPLKGKEGEDITEIRLSRDKPVLLCTRGGIDYLEDSKGNKAVADRESFDKIVLRLAGGSLYSVGETIKKGYVTIKGGIRVGVCGTAVTENGVIKNIKDISSLCFRIAGEVRGCAERLSREVDSGRRIHSVLIASPPGYGKTTMLRDLCRILADGIADGTVRRVGIADERCEIAGISDAVQYFDTGAASFVCSSYPRHEAMKILLRTMSPDIIVTDEIGTDDDFNAVKEAARSGVGVAASIHAWDMDDLKERFGKSLRVFSKIFFLKDKTGEFKMYRRCCDDY